jgi:hypothetical protein
MIPPVSAQQQEEPTLAVPLASKPLGPEDLKNENWLKAEYWEDSLEVPFPGNRPERQVYLRVKESRHETFPNFSVLVEAVTDTAEKPFGYVSSVFDTENMRYEVKDPTVPKTKGVYIANIEFESPGGRLINHPMSAGNPFPSNKFYYAWKRGPSPIAGSDEVRLKPHVLYSFLFSTEFLMRKYNEIGFHTRVHESEGVNNYLTYPASYKDYVKMSRSGIPIPELPWPAVALVGGMAAAALAARKMNRRAFLCLG